MARALELGAIVAWVDGDGDRQVGRLVRKTYRPAFGWVVKTSWGLLLETVSWLDMVDATGPELEEFVAYERGGWDK